MMSNKPAHIGGLICNLFLKVYRLRLAEEKEGGPPF
jgi:hypothetical protein